jgi:hypothetical protein
MKFLKQTIIGGNVYARVFIFIITTQISGTFSIVGQYTVISLIKFSFMYVYLFVYDLFKTPSVAQITYE